MNDLNAIRSALQESYEAPFPRRYGGVEIEGYDLAGLDKLAAGCIDRSVHHVHLDSDRDAILRSCNEAFSFVVKRLDGDARLYSNTLGALVRQVLNTGG